MGHATRVAELLLIVSSVAFPGRARCELSGLLFFPADLVVRFPRFSWFHLRVSVGVGFFPRVLLLLLVLFLFTFFD